MGLIGAILPGVRDLRTPLVVGYAWLLGAMLMFSSASFATEAISEIASSLAPAGRFYGDAAIVAVVTVAAYVIGGMVTVDTTYGSLSRIVPSDRPTLRDILAGIRFLGMHPIVFLRPAHDNWQRFMDAARLRMNITDLGDLSTRLAAENGALWRFNPRSLSVKLHIANQVLWEEYDRLNSEAEFRLSLVAPIVFLGLSAWRILDWWPAAIGITMAAVRLGLVGERKAANANGVLIQCLIARVIPLEDELGTTPRP